MPGPVATCMAVPTAPVAEAGTRQPPAPLTFLTESEAPGTEAVCFRPTKLFIGGISRNTTTKHLRDHFSKYGKVLDCVAMRLADGRPRGFGYVTLDSPAAAERCIREPQLLDNRIVDMKSAVPEGSSAHTSPKDMDRSVNAFAGYGFAEWPDASLYGPGTPWWTDGQFQSVAGRYGQMPDCLDLLNGAHLGQQPSGATGSPLFQAFADMAAHDPFDGTGLVLPPHMKMTLDDTQFTLSANAPEFVPRTSAAPEGTESRRSTPKSAATGTTPKSKAHNNGQNRSALGEITNIHITEVDDLLKPFKSPTKNSDVGQGQLSFPKKDRQPESPEEFPIFEDAEDDVSPTSQASTTEVRQDGETIGEEKKDDGASEASPEAEVKTDATDVDLDSLPSIGSVLHSKGECKRCNFFSKGRCQNGKDCAYCHFPHEKTKPTRQEKRERRAEWLDQQNAMCQQSENGADQKAVRSRQPLLQAYTSLTQTHSDATSQSTLLNRTAPSGIPQDGELYSDETIAYSIFPGLPPIRATKLPAPLPLPGTMDMQGHTRPALPPGLVAPSWQREAEVDPALDAMFVGTMGQHAFSQVVASTPYTSAPLSTAPSLAATPSALLSTTPTPTHTAPTSPTAVLATTPTGASTIGLLPTEDTTSSCATQTNEAYMCTRCEKSDVARSAEGSRWSRDELLQLRGAVADKSKIAPLFYTKAISAI